MHLLKAYKKDQI